MSLVLVKQLTLELASLLGLVGGHLLRCFLGHLAGGLLSLSLLLGGDALLAFSLYLSEGSNLFLLRGILLLLCLQLGLGRLLELLKGRLLLLDGVESGSLSRELLFNLVTHLDLSLDALVGLVECLSLTLGQLFLRDLLLEVSLGLDLFLLRLETVDLGLLLGLFSFALLGSLALSGDAFLSLLLLSLDSLLSTHMGVLLTELFFDVLLVRELVDGLKIVARGIIVVAVCVENALVGQKIIPVSKADSLRGAFSQ